MNKAAVSARRRIAFRPLATAAAALLLSAGNSVQAQSFTQSGANSTAPNNYLPFNEALLPVSLNFGNDTIYIANSAPGSFSALSGAQLTAGTLSIANGGVAGSVGSVTFDGVNPSTLVPTTVLLGGSGNRLEVGNWGTGTLNVSGGALLDASLNYAACGNGCNNFIGNAAGSTGTLNITGAGSEVRAVRGFVVGAAAVFTQALNGFTFGTPGDTTNAFVNVLAGGTLRTEQAIVGNGPNNPGATGTEKAFGTVVIDGVGSKWVVLDIGLTNIAAGLTIGNRVGGEGKVTVSGGGKLEMDGAGGPSAGDFINIGSNNGKGSLTVTGSGSSVDVFGSSGVIQVGRSGASAEGSFSVQAGGTASAVFMNVGRDGAKGNVVIDGAGSLVTMAGLGQWATGQVGGSAVTIGWNGGNGEVTVSDGGRLRVTDGGVNTSTSAGSSAINVGYIGGTGKLSINGANSVVEIVTTSINPGTGVPDNFNPFMAIGRDAGGTGELAISAGGKLLLQGNALSTPTFGRGTNLNIGGYSDTVVSGNGTATVTGPGSALRVQGVDAFIAVGRNGTGTLGLTNQALLETTVINVGRAANGNGTLTMDNSTMLLSGQYTGNPYSAGLALGSGNGSVGRATITNGSLVTITNMGSLGAGIYLGGLQISGLDRGEGELTLSGGSQINVVTAPGLATLRIGNDGKGTATITGASQINLGDGTVHVGRLAAGTGTLRVESGSKLLAGEFNLGGSSDTVAGGLANVTVTGAGSEIAARNDIGRIAVGRFGGNGVLDVNSGGTLTAKNLTVGRNGAGTFNADSATINLSGEQAGGFGAALSVGNRGGNGTATINNSTVTISNATAAGAALNVGGTAPNPLGTGLLNLTGGTTVNINAAAGLGTFNVGYDGNGTANINGPGTMVNVNNGGAVYVGRQIGSTGLLNMSDSAVLNAGFVGVGVSAAGTGNAIGAAGGTGTLALNNSTINTLRFELGAGSLLTGDGGVINVADTAHPVTGLQVKGPVVIAGTISPGNSPGRLRINCDITMLSDSKLILEINDRDGGPGVDFDIDQLIIGNDSKFDLTSLQIIFSFIGNTNPDEFAASPGGFNLDKFLKAGNGTNESAGLSTLFGNNPDGTKKTWDDVVDSELFAFESSAYDVTKWSLAPDGEITIEAAAVPEPASIALVLLALATMLLASRRRAARRAF
jgi:T5SS/PEP-CTERM-associated repeat protein